MKPLGRLLPCVVVAVISAAGWSPASADERKFTFVEEAKTLPQGTFEFEQWVTRSWGVEQGQFWRIDFREELEYGITDRLTAAAYLNLAITRAMSLASKTRRSSSWKACRWS